MYKEKRVAIEFRVFSQSKIVLTSTAFRISTKELLGLHGKVRDGFEEGSAMTSTVPIPTASVANVNITVSLRTAVGARNYSWYH